MPVHEIPTLERTIDGRRSMRSVADALEALRSAGHCRAGSLLEIRTSSLPAKTADAPSIVLVVCRATPSEDAWGVALPTSYEFTARSLGKDTAETFEISLLDRAKVDEDGAVELSDGTRLQAVNVVPAALPRELTELQKRVVCWTIKFIGAEKECFRSPDPDGEWLDEWFYYGALHGLEAPKLEAIVQYIAENDPTLKVTRQTIANAFLITGVTRAFTHQLVRTRTASYAQQAQQVLDMSQGAGWEFHVGPTIAGNVKRELKYRETMRAIAEGYKELVEDDAKIEEGGAPSASTCAAREGRMEFSERIGLNSDDIGGRWQRAS
jgi:hypothetical protein